MRSADDVVPARRALVGHAEADRSLVLVGLALGDEPLRDLAAVVHPVELERVVAVPVEPEPAERLLDLFDRLSHLAARVRVLDPKLELAALRTREEPIEHGGAHAPDVEHPGRARREADFDHVDSVGACAS